MRAGLKLGPVAKESNFTIFDVGARGGANSDFDLFASGSIWIGFEPDQEESARVSSVALLGDFAEALVVNRALGRSSAEVSLNLFSRGGSNSILSPQVDKARVFDRAGYFQPTGKAKVEVVPLDQIVKDLDLPSPSFVKLDVQGFEMEVLAGAVQALASSIIGLRVECYFQPMYTNQPVFSDIETFLRGYGFSPFGFVELHEWRRDSLAKPPKRAGQSPRYSRGQLVHGDVIFFKSPEELIADERDGAKLVNLGLALAAYEHYDAAHRCFSSAPVVDFLSENLTSFSLSVIKKLSRRRLVRRLGLP